jgi:galactokinase
MSLSFHSVFSGQPAVRVTTPGRVNLIGEHTDYNDGFVLPTVIPQGTTVELSLHDGAEVEVVSANMPAADQRKTYTLGQEKKTGHWHDYVQGVTSELKLLGITLRGFKALVSSTVPTGSGLSSSAALEVAVTKALRSALGFKLSDIEIAKLGQRVENHFVGANVGIMDQMAVSLAEPGSALFLDTRDLSYELVTLPKEAGLIVINSGVKHSNIGGGYSERRAQCEAAAKELGLKALRDINVSQLDLLKNLPLVVQKRARHVITENDRVLKAKAALLRGDLVTVGELFKQSHQSMRDDFQVSIPEIDVLVEIASNEAGVYGARLTGGGFGGSIVALVKPDAARSVAKNIARLYQQKTGVTATVLVPE